MKNVEYLVGSENITNKPMRPFNDQVVEFSATLSKNLLKSPYLRMYNDITALAFWCRKANIMKLKENCPEAENRLGRGLCFHVAPGNIPINFAFSYMFGALAGCSNIVRLSSKPFPQIKPLCDIFTDTLENFPEIKNRTAFVRYNADDKITAQFSSEADARVIWGGDQTVAKLKAMESKVRCVDVCFSDRYSLCIIDGNAIGNSTEKELNNLAELFYNDTYLMDQNACSSQQLILWLNDNEKTRQKFWSAIEAYAQKNYNLQWAVSVDKYTHMYEDILDGKPVQKITHKNNLLYRVELSNLDCDVTQLRGKGGYFYEKSISGLEEIIHSISEKIQTITYFGVSASEIREYVIDNNVRGIDRIVPIGKAMDIDIMWDGYDLVRTLSRRIDIQ